MKRTSLAAVVMLSACAYQAAHAQSSVTLYGVVDNGIEYQSGGAGHVVRASSGGLFATVYGFVGHEDLGGGLRVNFQLEQGFSAVNGAPQNSADAFNRLAWVGMSGRFGELRIGRQKKPQYQYLDGEIDPLAAKSIASPLNDFDDVSVRASNAITWFTPAWHGLTAQFLVAMRDSTTTPSNGLQSYNVVVKYVNGPWHIAAGYDRQDNAAGTSVQNVFTAATSLKVAAARFYLVYHTETQTDHSQNEATWSASVSWQINPTNEVAALYGYLHDRTGSGNNAQQFGLAYEYLLSKSSILYVAAGLMDNRRRAAYGLNGTEYSGVDVTPGATARGVIVGLTHKF
ncbi:TPA: porin [Burkholderia multivorans]|uniref:porin n=1 Tax=Burkholderia multivorans TaxID=87883 RepID=UPI000CFE3B11|nr:porin [Burkholderia multivorans]MBU9182450.1 porin [Burkholderia multivorans]MBU9316019.1 porin [Burkholderia multivorans]MBU9335249.1 porin [Burkholderia multivorans]MCL4663123.1 porin [Burkholderia multivorans]MCO1356637.1 porin [Burkholderia multivorans]